MAENYQSIFEGEEMDALWTLAGTAVQKAKVNGQTINPVAGVLILPDYPSQVTWDNIQGKPSWIGSTKPTYTLAELTGDTMHRVVTDAQITAWNGAASKAHEHANKTSVLDKLKWDATNNAIYIGDANNPISFYAFGEITAGGIGSGGGGGGGLASLYFNGVRADDGEVAKFGIKVNGTWASVLTDSEKGKYVDISTAAGSVTSVGLSVPTGFSVTGSPITSSGTLAIGFVSGYSLPTTAKQTSWDTAYSWGNHASAGYLTGITSLMVTTALGYTPVNKAGDTISGVLYPTSDSGIDFGSATRKWHYGYFHRLLRLTSITTSDTYNTNMITVPAKAGTMALTSDIPTNNNQLTNGAGYITSSGSCAYATNAGNADTLDGQHGSYYASASSLGNYLPLSGGVLSNGACLAFGNESNAAYTYVRFFRNGGITELRCAYDGSTELGNEYSGLTGTLKITPSAAYFNKQTIYHSGNCNNFSTPWRASSLTLNESIEGASSLYFKPSTNPVIGVPWSATDGAVYNYIRLNVGDGGIEYHSGEWTSGNVIAHQFKGTIRSDVMTIMSGGNVGIGTTSPSEKLDVSGNVSIGTSSGGYVSLKGGIRLYHGLFTANMISDRWSSTDLALYTDHSLHILAADGIKAHNNFVCDGEVTAGSDMRWKHNITPVLNGLNAIMRLKPSEWEWNSDNHKGSGLIAQSVQSVLPHLVKEDGEGYLHLTYDGLHAYEISALQSHETRIQQLERENAELKRMLNINS